MQQSLSAHHSLQPSSRHSIVANILRSIDNFMPTAIIRVDIERFYETIDHATLLRLLDTSELPPTNKRLVRLLLSEFTALTGSPKGVPTGVGVSSRLAEMYLQALDYTLMSDSRTSYYARYVDDILIVRGLENADKSTDLQMLAPINASLNALGLKSNATKTAVTRRASNGDLPSFEFLGYRISHSNSPAAVLTQRRLDEICGRVDRTFDVWDKRTPTDHGARRLLLDRLRFLTGNARLSNNKRNAMVGIYFSNPHITDPSCLIELDLHLQSRASSSALQPELAAKVATLSFADGYKSRRIHRFTPRQLTMIRGAWSD
nr:antiviral reverse transcriptase Drt3a [Plantibacter sp. CFBP 8798]